MAIIKIKKKDRYTVINNQSLTDARLSWKARGLWAYLMSLPPDWEVSVADLVKRSPDGRDLVYNILKELKQYGYIEHRFCRENGKIVKGEYLVFEEPHTEKPYTDFPDTVEPYLEKTTQLNTNRTKETNNKETAAIENSSNQRVGQPEADKKSIAAADNESLNSKDCLIDSELTPKQQKVVIARVGDLAKQQGLSETKLIAEVKHVLLNPECFSACGNDFSKKLNTIAKQIRENKWSTPADLVSAAETKKAQQRHTAMVEISNLIGQIESTERLLHFAKDETHRAHFQQAVGDLKLRLKNLKKQHREELKRETQEITPESKVVPPKTRAEGVQSIRKLVQSFAQKTIPKSITSNRRQPCVAAC
jgi:hypothetical protein